MKALPPLSTALLPVAALSAQPAAGLSARGVSPVTARAVSWMIDRYGGKRAVDKLIAQVTSDRNNDLGEFEAVLDGISSGDPEWLALVPRLDTGGHAAAGESLPIAVAFALPKNAPGVLRLITRDRRWLVACGYPMIEPTRKEERAYFTAAIPAVKAVHERTLQPAKRMCLSELVKAERAP